MEQINTQYDYIRQEYPEIISKDQFYRIAHISKATALYLLQSGKVPCIDSGKKTRRYKIYTDDVIRYLIDRDINPLYYKADSGWYTHRPKSYVKVIKPPENQFRIPKHTVKMQAKLKAFLEITLEQNPDLISVKNIREYSGYSENTVRYWIQKGHLKALKSGTKYLIPKVYFIEFLCTDYAMAIRSKSKKHIELLHNFQLGYNSEKRGT